MPSSAKTPASSRHKTAATSGRPTKVPRRRASLPVGAGASVAANAKTRGAMRSRAMLAQAQPVRMALVRMSITKASGSFWATRPTAPQIVKKTWNRPKATLQAIAPLATVPDCALTVLISHKTKWTVAARPTSEIAAANMLRLLTNLKPTKAGGYPIVTKLCAAFGGCTQPAILTRACGSVAQCSGDLRDNGRELHGNVKAP